MLDRVNNKIYIKYRENDIIGSIGAIIGSGFFGISIYQDYINNGNGWLNRILKYKFMMVLVIIISIIVFIVGALSIFFAKDINYYIDLNIKKIILMLGKKPFRTEISLDFNEIKEILIIRRDVYVQEGRSGKKVDKYFIDLYDEKLNAYECYDSENLETIIDIANELVNVLDVEVVDKTGTEDYEGFIKRII
ncbi:hypothetical protein FACS189485_19960 [Spirochaetia bacterium]|nr:hypothetical protein FACS189485_19960 [Spirochaetia bacterium]